MAQRSALELFVERIMNTNVMRGGGASTGILGSSGTDNVILNSLKNSTIAFASEYREPKPNQAKLKQLSDYIYGYLQTLQLTYTLSNEEANKLIVQLDKIMDKA